MGFAFDVSGTWAMHLLATGPFDITEPHTLTGQIALWLMFLHAIWATRALYYNGSPIEGGPTDASVAVQIPAMQDTFTASAVLVVIALVLAVWALVSERRARARVAPASTGP